MRPYKHSDDEVRQVIAGAESYAQALRLLGDYQRSGSAHRSLQKRVAALDLDTSHFKPLAQLRQRPRKNLLVLGSAPSDNRNIIRALLRSGVKKRCVECGNHGEWREKPLRIHLDHKNGNAADNRIENLRFLCPNCHDQTETWGRTRPT